MWIVRKKWSLWFLKVAFSFNNVFGHQLWYCKNLRLSENVKRRRVVGWTNLNRFKYKELPSYQIKDSSVLISWRDFIFWGFLDAPRCIFYHLPSIQREIKCRICVGVAWGSVKLWDTQYSLGIKNNLERSEEEEWEGQTQNCNLLESTIEMLTNTLSKTFKPSTNDTNCNVSSFDDKGSPRIPKTMFFYTFMKPI